MFSLCPVTFLTGSWRVSRNKCLCWASSGRLEPAGAEAAQVRTAAVVVPSDLGSAQLPAPSPLVFLVPGFACPCPLNPAFQAPMRFYPWRDGRGISGTSQCPLFGCGSSVAAHPSCCFTSNYPKISYLCKSQPTGAFPEAFTSNLCPAVLPLMLAEFCGLFPARSCGISI